MKLLHENHQLHFFVQNTDIEASAPFINAISSKLEKYSLVPVSSKEFNPSTGQHRDFLTLVSTKIPLRIEFPSNEIVITSESGDQNNFKLLSFEVLDSLASLFPLKMANRLSVLNTKIFQDSSESYDLLYSKLFTHHRALPFEWDNRVVERLQLDESGEQINSISAIRRLEVRSNNISGGQPTDVITFDIDSNTIFQNQSSRFTLADSLRVLAELFSNNEKVSEDLSRYF